MGSDGTRRETHVVMVVTNDMVSDPRVEKEAEALVSAGYGVTIVAWGRTGDAPPSEKRNGYLIERLGPSGAYGGGLKSLPLFRRFWADAADRVLALKPDVVHCHDLDTAPVGLAVLKRADRRPRFVLDLHELYRYSRMVPRTGIKGVVARFAVSLLERRAYSAADVMLVANPGTAYHYEQMGFSDKVVMIENAADAELFRPRTKPPADRPFTVGYIGQKRYTQSLVTLMDIVERNEGLGAFLAGGGTAAQQIDRIAEAMPRVETHGRYTYAEQPALYERCDAVYGLYDSRVGNIKTAFPVKVMEGMACALPVIVNAGTWIGDYVAEQGIGFAVDGADDKDIERALLALRDDPGLARRMGRRGRELVEAGLSWQRVSGKLIEVYSRL